MDPASSAPMERGKELRRLRKAAGLTQRQVGAAFDGTSGAAVSGWETGTTSPEWTKLKRLDDLLRAEGAVLEMFGAADLATPTEVSRLRDAVEAQSHLIEELASQVALLMDERAQRTRGRAQDVG